MSARWAGGCGCGTLRYSMETDPIAMVDCQCRDCQFESGTGHASHVVFECTPAVLTGEAAEFQMFGESGRAKTRHFCKICGSPVLMSFSAHPRIISVRAATLDTPERYKPQFATYISRGYKWDHLDPDIPKFDRMP
ncbi:GFA family protein [Asticcacaulis currens]|uniref:GFA family protein n=1 Tax=Asticcacaulis currens TaxID=2984210 RepID=UPI003F6175B2